MRSPIAALEEWLFKLTRPDPFKVVPSTIEEATRFKELMKRSKCPACQQTDCLEVNKFERGPKGWETDIVCSNCNFQTVISQLSSALFNVSSKGKAREK